MGGDANPAKVPTAGEYFSKAISSIPTILGDSINHWPAAITFAGVGYAESMILSAIPNPGGTAGMLLAAWARGWTQVVSFATWDVMGKEKYTVFNMEKSTA